MNVAVTLVRAHILVGVAGMLLFVLQGQYMGQTLLVPELPDGERLMYRSAHLYLMLACALNIVAGCYLPAVLGKLRLLASLLLLVAPLMLIYSFFAESTSPELQRPVTVFAMYFIFAATLSLLAAGVWERWRAKPEPNQN